MALTHYINLLRVRQWYKNLVVFLAIFFSANILNRDMIVTTVVAFLALCFVSSTGYIINDLHDRKKDALHPEKQKRPLASGAVKIHTAIILAIITLVLGFYLAAVVGPFFLIATWSLFILTLIYTFLLKKYCLQTS